MNTTSLFLARVFWARCAGVVLLAASVLAAHQAAGADIWNGPLINFTNIAGSSPSLPSSQDRLTLNVWLTRGLTQGLYNAAVEASYSSLSPVGTEWAYGELGDYASLSYQPWVVWNGQHPPNMVGQDAVLHLIPDDVYLSVQFTFWNTGAGGFSYTRSSPPIPEPSTALMLLAGTAIVAVARFRCLRPRASAGEED